MRCPVTISQPIDFDERQRERKGADVSALMSTYAGETASNLKDSLESVLLKQFPPTNWCWWWMVQ